MSHVGRLPSPSEACHGRKATLQFAGLFPLFVLAKVGPSGCSGERYGALYTTVGQGFRSGFVSRSYRIAAIPGDGIGSEVVPQGLRCLRAVADVYGFRLEVAEFDFASADYWRRHGVMLPSDWKSVLGAFDAIYFGAVGWPEVVPDHVSLWGSLLQMRRG